MLLDAKVTYQRPDYKKLISEGYLLLDTHTHTYYSDSNNRIGWMIRRLKRLNINAAITDHNEVRGVIEAMKKNSGRIVPGIEVTSKEGRDVLLLFYEKNDLLHYYHNCLRKYVNKSVISRTKLPMMRILEDSQKYSCVRIAPHPYGYMWKNFARLVSEHRNGKQMIGYMHSLEVINSDVTRKKNLLALELAKKYGKGVTGGSDAHVYDKIGRCITYSKANSFGDLLDDIRKKRACAIGKEGAQVRNAITYSIPLSKQMRYTAPVMKGHINKSIRPRIKKIRKKAAQSKGVRRFQSAAKRLKRRNPFRHGRKDSFEE